ncbi:MAG: alanine--tRNA ligase [Thermoplasmata archaeon HGW-Thermoplasmata-1]|nr:MAG: alanine--tRNA ligase [Thermoplasmata archaeon HGW-Thermoplasmata-1]
MDPKLEKQLNLEFFRENGFTRKTCASCGANFWTLDPSQENCGDQPCVEYSFIGNPLTKKPFEVHGMRERFLNFFENHGHTRLKRYPVVARWRSDIYLTIASIADFQPHITSGDVPPPANPLTISQPCIRLNDLSNVGKSGRHLTTFEMMAHHAFNRPDDQVYWAEETVGYCNNFLQKALSIPGESISYKEQVWAGGGNAGPCLEVLVGGLELATLVFMNMKTDPNGQFEAKGDRYSEMDLRIVDTGYGLERFVWASQGTPTVYDAVFPEMIGRITAESGIGFDPKEEYYAKIIGETATLAGLMDIESAKDITTLRKGVVKRLAGKGVKMDLDELTRIMAPIENVYALADHSRCLAFMLGDGIIPSNAKAGYLARLVIRRSIRLMDQLGIKSGLDELILDHLHSLGRGDFPELMESQDRIRDIIEIETGRYSETLSKGERLIERTVKKSEEITNERLIDFYDTHGIPPDMVSTVAQRLGARVAVPDNFESMVAERHMGEKKTEVAKTDYGFDLPNTRLLYYEQPHSREFDAVVLWAEAFKEGGSEEHNARVVLDQTLFYPEGGGQPCDFGVITTPQHSLKVSDVQKVGNTIIHTVEGRIKTGEMVHGQIDWDRRQALMRHHTATHIVNGAAQEVLGRHIWQAGSQLGVNSARFDISHYKRITPEELQEIEMRANEIALEGIPVEKNWLERGDAEKKYSFRLYQGGVPPGTQLRVVRIPGVDTEACAGMHCKSTSDVGSIRILRTERIQDGVERLEFAAGLAAIELTQQQDNYVRGACDTLSVTPENLPKSVERFFEEWKSLRKEIEDLRAAEGGHMTKNLLESAEKVKGVRIAAGIMDWEMPDMVRLAATLTKEQPKLVVILGSGRDGGKIVVGRSGDVPAVHAGEAVRAASRVMGGGGGGRPDMAQGGGPEVEKLGEAVATAKLAVFSMLETA